MCRAAGSVRALPPDTGSTFWAAATSIATAKNMSSLQAPEGNVRRLTKGAGAARAERWPACACRTARSAFSRRQEEPGSTCQQLLDPRHRVVELRLRSSERKPRIAAKSRGPVAAPLPGIHVEELAGHGDHLLLQRGAEEPHPVVQRRRE